MMMSQSEQRMGLPRESWFSRHRISVEEYYRMGEAEILPPDARVELIDGEVIDMAAIGPSHAAVTNDLLSVLLSAVNGKGLVRGQAPIHLNDQSEPQPDVVIARLRPGNYRDAHPGPSDILLLIEVSDTTLRFDREVKVPVYAQAGVPEVWIVDLNGRKVQ
jgi:Uma2 family endonuclease